MCSLEVIIDQVYATYSYDALNYDLITFVEYRWIINMQSAIDTYQQKYDYVSAWKRVLHFIHS